MDGLVVVVEAFAASPGGMVAAPVAEDDGYTDAVEAELTQVEQIRYIFVLLSFGLHKQPFERNLRVLLG